MLGAVARLVETGQSTTQADIARLAGVRYLSQVHAVVHRLAQRGALVRRSRTVQVEGWALP